MADSDPSRAAAVAAVRALRDRTGLPISACVQLLNESDGDVERAVALRYRPPLTAPPRAFRCPDCGEGLRGPALDVCGRCAWMRFAGDRAAWGTAGRCPRCGFTYRWDGARCSHCGEGTTERPPVPIPIVLPRLTLPRLGTDTPQ